MPSFVDTILSSDMLLGALSRALYKAVADNQPETIDRVMTHMARQGISGETPECWEDALYDAVEKKHGGSVAVILAQMRKNGHSLSETFLTHTLGEACNGQDGTCARHLLEHSTLSGDRVSLRWRYLFLNNAVREGNEAIVDSLITHDRHSPEKIEIHKIEGLNDKIPNARLAAYLQESDCQLRQAAESCDLPRISHLMQQDTQHQLSVFGRQKALFIAAEKGDVALMEAIMEHDANCTEKLSPAHHASAALLLIGHWRCDEAALMRVIPALAPENRQKEAAPYETFNHPSLTFGVEIEAFGLPSNVRVSLLEAAPKLLPGSVYTEDASIIPDDHSEGFEIPTGILHNAHSVARLHHFLRLLEMAGAKVNDSCGLHIHLGTFGDQPAILPDGTQRNPIRPSPELQGKGVTVALYQLSVIKQFLLYYAHTQKTLNSVLRDGKGFLQDSNTYSKNIPENAAAIRRAANLRALQDLVNPEGGGPGYSRYYAVNLRTSYKLSHHNHLCRTIEVRHHDGSINADAIIGWAGLMHGTMALAINSVDRQYQLHAPTLVDAHLAVDEQAASLLKQWLCKTNRKVVTALKNNPDFYTRIVHNHDLYTLQNLLHTEDGLEVPDKLLAAALTHAAPPPPNNSGAVRRMMSHMLSAALSCAATEQESPTAAAATRMMISMLVAHGASAEEAAPGQLDYFVRLHARKLADSPRFTDIIDNARQKGHSAYLSHLEKALKETGRWQQHLAAQQAAPARAAGIYI